MSSPVVIILAAGRGERFLASGGKTHKLEALLGGQTVLAHVIQAVEAAALPWHLVRPEGGTRGMGESISLGVQATSEASGWLILPADLPLIQPASLLRVAEGLREKGVVVPYYQQQAGHPVGFRREYGEALLELAGDVGAKEIVRGARRRGDVGDVWLPDIGITYDIDTLADLQTAQEIRYVISSVPD
ncbi:NTP transferase domain-containing protein [Leclercia sp. 119287]|uniref:nucleotidyltransferase family protein n=1 Tax=Leclercia sp. 119287 TaxID=2681308 RepID=UPI0012E1471F|nr:nucleotidyltransferase family protein [Leclercia sp. 119287]QGU14048.1 NTP transferase domain-containing protein [Leclercia sp. 119287]